ncbi:MAG: flagellar brake protein [Bacillota bacterium]
MLDNLKVNQLIDIEVEEDFEYSGTYRTRVEDVNEKGIVIGMPFHNGQLIPLRPGTTVIIQHWDSSASYKSYCKVKDRSSRPIPLVFLGLPFKVKKVQRRSFVRVPVNIEIEYRLDSEEDVPFSKSLTRDLSGGGTQFSVKGNFEKGQRLIIKLHLPEEIVTCKAVVMWVYCENIEDIQRIFIGVQYTEILEKTRDKIIKYVFERQRELIKKGVL